MSDMKQREIAEALFEKKQNRELSKDAVKLVQPRSKTYTV